MPERRGIAGLGRALFPGWTPDAPEQFWQGGFWAFSGPHRENPRIPSAGPDDGKKPSGFSPVRYRRYHRGQRRALSHKDGGTDPHGGRADAAGEVLTAFTGKMAWPGRPGDALPTTVRGPHRYTPHPGGLYDPNPDDCFSQKLFNRPGIFRGGT